ncbi:hypothetical protein G1L01_13500 [Tenacibaculum finnmarkense]|uniref:M91 family zinc metallopeptidase n=1 Tax=Tenacibaculum finnmarkense TaxID=2781243 RepID=UPI00187B3754|nr:M91 family zinc metallopeptidase [Tenacibaculum finnmarkense]MBE7661516.1 hypothetical protein [Tenacibaculum finnmarkense genomovar finnmarkense]MCD8418798.1 type III secretion system effector protein [Tenacibaculum finnmarkense genomovar finnmarkense]MCG8187097.1 hypothetical protein [Tenacibaculum finnmarkense genomovar finnmarkense]MCG8203663.1 hypothetical protein [Tenacibaculum finnmarkense genomovar finnmarkense]MCG8221257.1 hypothetical protein [Tenacibaculum finnmarkense genomovar 
MDIISYDFMPIVKIDLLQTNTSNRDETWVYENFEIIEKKASTEDLVSDVSNCIISFYPETKEIIVKFKVESASDESDDDDGYIRFIPKGITLKTKEKIQIEYEQYFALRLSLDGIENDAYIDFYADDDGEGYFDEKGKQNISCGRIFVKESELKPGLFISFMEGKSEIDHRYVYGANYSGTNQFVKDVHMALDHIIKNEADTTDVIKKVTENKKMIIRIKENNKKNNFLFEIHNRDTYFNPLSKIVVFSPYRANKFTVNPGLFSSTGNSSPAEILLHELAHAQSYIEDPEEHLKDKKHLIKGFTDQEEKDVILDVEQPAAKQLGRKVIRNSHTGSFYDTISPISIVEKSK